MKLFGDYHTHTVFSRNHHGKSTIEQNVKVAYEKGLKAIGITEHGFNHIFFGVRRRKIKKMRAEIERLQKIYPIKIYLGIEANLVSAAGDIDLTKQEQLWFDYVIMGYHEMARPKSFADWKNFFRPNKRAYKKNAYTEQIVQANTNAYISAIKNNKINIISHIGSKMKVDIAKIAQVCKQTGTLLEINGRRICYTQNDVEQLVQMCAKFVVNSDAHRAKNVGECNYATNFVIKHNIPLELVQNFDKEPKLEYTEIK